MPQRSSIALDILRCGILLWLLLPKNSLGGRKQGVHYNRYFAWRRWRNLNDLTIQKGDVIVCLLKSVPGVVLRIPHWLLAVDSSLLLGVSKPGLGYVNIGKVRLTQKDKLDDKYLDIKKCHNLGNFNYNRDEVVKRALKWKGHYVYVHPFRCNAQHFIYFWLSGDPGGGALSFPHLSVNQQCKLYGLDINYTPPPNLRANAFVEKKYGETVWKFWNGETLVPDTV